MNAKELIEYYEEKLKTARENDAYFKRIYARDKKTYPFVPSGKVDLFESTLSLISATIPRETAKCEWCESNDRVEIGDRKWVSIISGIIEVGHEDIDENYSCEHLDADHCPRCGRRLPMPAAPEVTP